MARVPYVRDEDASEEVRHLFEAQRRLGGRITNFHRLFANLPWVFKWFVPFQVALTKSDDSLLDREVRILVQIKTSIVNSCDYCASHTTDMGKRTGLSDEQIEGLQEDPSPTAPFSAAEHAAITWAASVAKNRARRDKAAFQALEEHFTAEQIVELTVLAAGRTMVNLIQEALWTDLEAEGEIEPPRIAGDVGDLGDYARSLM